MNKTIQLKIDQAIVSLICNQPFIATILLRLVRVEDPFAPTMWTDGRRLGYNPDFVDKLRRDELIGVLAHEVFHVAGLHPWRRGTREPFPWNVAADMCVNQICEDCNLTLPNGCIPPVPNKSAEELYSTLPPMPKASGGDGQGNDPGGCGEVRDPTNEQGQKLSDAELEQQMDDAKVLVQQAANAAKKAGKFPAGLNRYVDEALEPKVPWREILARFMSGAYKNDYSWSRPNRRYISSGILFPALRSPGYGKVVFGCDTSGSIDQKQLQEICSEVIGCMQEYETRGQSPELTVVWFDTRAYVQTVTDASELQPQGGGGTDFSVVFDWVNTQCEDPPQAVILVTDGYCNSFGDQPACKVLYVLTQQNREFAPPWGEIACVLNN